MGTYSIDIGKVVGEDGQDGQTGPQGPQGPSGSETTVTNAALAHTTGTKSMKVVLTLQDNSTVESGEVAVPGNFGAFSRAPTDGDKANYDQFLDLSNGKLWKLDAETDEWVEGPTFMLKDSETATGTLATGVSVTSDAYQLSFTRRGNVVQFYCNFSGISITVPNSGALFVIPEGFRPASQSFPMAFFIGSSISSGFLRISDQTVDAWGWTGQVTSLIASATYVI